jgi:hypothetical protein
MEEGDPTMNNGPPSGASACNIPSFLQWGNFCRIFTKSNRLVGVFDKRL